MAFHAPSVSFNKGESMFKPLIISGLCACAALAQTIVMKTAAEFSGPMGITGVLASPASTIPGAPYSAEAVTQRIQFLADGNRIAQSTTNAVARDGKGRVYREESMPGFSTSGQDLPHMVVIDDPVAKVHLSLDPTNKIAYKLPPVEQKRLDEAAVNSTVHILQPANVSTRDIEIVAEKAKLDQATAPTTTADLGTQMMEGVLVKGTKITRTIPAGTIGNDLPITITTEAWYSPELKVLVMSKSNDPRMGESTYKLQNLVRGEPNPALFQIPSDYTTKDQPNQIFFVKRDDK
jgi:hypothetical protein